VFGGQQPLTEPAVGHTPEHPVVASVQVLRHGPGNSGVAAANSPQPAEQREPAGGSGLITIAAIVLLAGAAVAFMARERAWRAKTAHLREGLDLEGKIHRVDPDFGSTLTVSSRDSQSNCWVRWKIMGQPCEFQGRPAWSSSRTGSPPALIATPETTTARKGGHTSRYSSTAVQAPFPKQKKSTAFSINHHQVISFCRIQKILIHISIVKQNHALITHLHEIRRSNEN
jgi:hypothetical protein